MPPASQEPAESSERAFGAHSASAPQAAAAGENELRPAVLPFGRHFRNEPRKSRHRLWIALCCVGLLVVVVGAGGFMAMRLRANVSTSALNLGDGGGLEDGATDILVIGSDTRAGSDAKYGDASDATSGARSDVMMLVQISKDHQNVNVVSFPRDLMVDIPQCKDSSGKVYPEEKDTQINESLNNGGPGCTVATISKLTGIHIDHSMLVDFNAVKALSSVVGGVEVCVTDAIDDSYSGLKLPKGTSTVEGEQALSFLRSRHGFGDGSDTSRIRAQQGFLSSLLRKVKSQGTLSNPGKLYDIAEAITQNTTVDEDFTNPKTLMEVGEIFGQVDLSKVVFATVPTEPYAQNQNKLQLADSAQEVFKKLQNDESLAAQPAASASAAPSSSAAATPSPTATLDRSVEVTVMNATGKSGRGEELAQKVKAMGYQTVDSQDASTTYSASTVYYGYGYQKQAEEIAKKFGVPSGNVQVNAQYTGVVLEPGTDFASGDKIQGEDTDIAGGAKGQTAEQNTCQQSYAY